MNRPSSTVRVRRHTVRYLKYGSTDERDPGDIQPHESNPPRCWRTAVTAFEVNH
jgi:hypothetical protein